jgi:thiamine-monophosphate kinase
MRESALLQHIYSFNRAISAKVLIPPGDDMGMIALEGTRLLAAVDQVVEGRHFRSGTPLELVGRKAVTRNVSDIAAMAARPVAALAAGVLPREMTEADANRLFDAMRRTADDYGCPLIGGDISMHGEPGRPLVCSVTVLAEPWGPMTPPRRRSDAVDGDGVYVTGALGGSLGADGMGRHLTFEPRVHEAAALARALGDRLHAMIDISDGLGRDAGRIAEASGMVIDLEAEAIPRHPGVTLDRAIGDGEDYELCFSVAGAAVDGALRTAVTRIGTIRRPRQDERTGAVWCTIDGRRDDVSAHGWEHAG